MFIGLSLGFGGAGVVAGRSRNKIPSLGRGANSIGSAAAAFQSAVYGGFTPASGVFATLTSLAMLGILAPAIALVAGVVASIIAALVWNTW